MSIQRILHWGMTGSLFWLSMCLIINSIVGTYIRSSIWPGLVSLFGTVLAILWDIGVIKIKRSSFKPTYYVGSIGQLIIYGYVLFFFFPLKDDMSPAILFILIALGNIIILSISILIALVKEVREIRERAHQYRLQS